MRTRRIRRLSPALYSAISLSPTTVAPSSKSAMSWTFSVVTGSTRPVMASTSLIRATASSKLPLMSLRAARNRLPKLWPFSVPSLKR